MCQLVTLCHPGLTYIFNFWHSGTLALRAERQSARMPKIKNGGLDQYGAEPFEQQQFGTADIERVNVRPVWRTAVDPGGVE